MKICTVFIPRNVLTGPGSVAQLGVEAKKLGATKVLIVTDKGVSAAGMLDTVKQPLKDAGLKVGVYDKAVPEPPMETVLEAAKMCEKNGYDCVVGFGGGSAMDTAKMVAVLPGTGKTVEDYIGLEKVEKPGLPLLTVPTTAGTGSEVTKFAIFSNEKLNIKQGVVSPYLIPAVAIVDPVLTVSCPPRVSAASGIDALIHNIEGVVSLNANPVADMFALEGIRLINRSIRTAVYMGSDLEARYQMALGALYGGVCLNSAGASAVHALSYPIGGRFHVPHGESNALMLPWVMEYSMLGCLDRMVRIAVAMDLAVEGYTPREAAELVVDELKQLCADLNLPMYLSDVGIPEDVIEEMADGCFATQARLLSVNPRPVSRNDIVDIYTSCAVRPAD